MKRIGGFRRKSRHKFTKSKRSRGKVSITKYLQKFEISERVYLSAEPSVQKGMYYPKFMGKSGIVMGVRGRCYKIQINDLGKDKMLIVHPIHLRKVS